MAEPHDTPAPGADGRWLSLRLALYGVALTALWSPFNALLLPELVSDRVPGGVRGTAIGALTFVGIGVAVLVQPIAGVVSDRWRGSERRRPFILVGTLAAAGMTLVLGWLPTFALLFAGYVVVQLGTNVAQASFQALIPDLVPEKARGRASGLKTGLGVGGSVLGLGLAAGLGALGAPAEAALSCLGLVLGLSVLTLLVVPPTPPAQKGFHAADLLGAFAPLWNGPSTFRVGVLMRFLFLLGIYPFQRFLVFFLEDSFGVEDPGLAVTTATVAGIGAGAVGAVATGLLADVLGPKRILLAIIPLTAITLLVVAVAPGIWWVLGAGVVLGFVTGAFQSANWTVLARSVPEGQGAHLLGIANMATAGAGAVAGLLGPAIDLLQHLLPVIAYPATFALAALIAALSLLPTLRIDGVEQGGAARG